METRIPPGVNCVLIKLYVTLNSLYIAKNQLDILQDRYWILCAQPIDEEKETEKERKREREREQRILWVLYVQAWKWHTSLLLRLNDYNPVLVQTENLANTVVRKRKYSGKQLATFLFPPFHCIYVNFRHISAQCLYL